MVTTRPRQRSTPKPHRPAGACRHPKLHHNRHVNEHMTYCAMHTKAARDRQTSAAQKKAHEAAAAMHMAQALHHMRSY